MKISCILILPLLTACVQPMPAPPTVENSQGWSLQLEPDTSLTESEPVVALHLRADGGDDVTLPEGVVLVEGEPSKISLGKYEEGETTEALAERLVPVDYFEEPNHLELRPRGVLAIGQTYSVLSREGVLGTIVVVPRTNRVLLSRVWPPCDSAYSIEQAIYCGKRAPIRRAELALFPEELGAKIELGLDKTGTFRDTCVRLIPERSTKLSFLPPLGVDEFAFDPSPFANSKELEELGVVACENDESSFGPGCLKIDGDRAVVRGPSGMTYWVLSSSAGNHAQILEANGRFVIPSLREVDDGVLTAMVFDLAGRTTSARAKIELPAPSARLVVNEVMSNPLGAEPAEEWVEIVNSGEVAATLIDYVLSDGSGKVELPDIVLGPGAFVLLTREDFVGGTAGDVAPRDGTTIVRLPQLGKGGLLNSGEAISLLDSAGNVVSTFPAKASERAGVSVARRSTSTLDDDATGFLAHAVPGASPGFSNEVE